MLVNLEKTKENCESTLLKKKIEKMTGYRHLFVFDKFLGPWLLNPRFGHFRHENIWSHHETTKCKQMFS